MGNLIGLRFDTRSSEGLLLPLQPPASGPDFRLLQTPLNATEHTPSPPVLCFSLQRTGQLVTCYLSRPLIFGPSATPRAASSSPSQWSQGEPRPCRTRGQSVLTSEDSGSNPRPPQGFSSGPAMNQTVGNMGQELLWKETHVTRNPLEQSQEQSLWGSSGQTGMLIARKTVKALLSKLGLAQRRNLRKKTGHEATSCTLRPTPIFPEPTTRAIPYSLQSPKPQRPEQARLHLHTCPASSGTRDPGPLPPAPCAFLTSLCSFFLPSQPLFSNEKAENAGWGIGSPGLSSGGKITFTLDSLWQNWPFHSLALNMRLGRGGRKSQKVGLCRTHCLSLSLSLSLSLCVCVCVCLKWVWFGLLILFKLPKPHTGGDEVLTSKCNSGSHCSPLKGRRPFLFPIPAYCAVCVWLCKVPGLLIVLVSYAFKPWPMK